MPVEKSSGAVVFRKDKHVKYLLLHYEAGHWDFPKGHIEKNESEQQAALREIKEETGVSGVSFVDGFKETIKYFYKKEGKTVFKTVVFFIAETKTEKVKISFEHIGSEWLEYKDAFERLTYKNAKDVLEKADKFLMKK